MKSFYTTLFALLISMGAGYSLFGQTTLVADFSFQPLQPCAGQPVIFIDASTGGTASSPNGAWGNYDFGDGTFGYPGSTGGNPTNGNNVTHTYTSAGTYQVTYCLYTQTFLGLDTSCVTKTLTVSAGPCTQLADTISGRVYFDSNNNGTYEAASDFPLKYKWVQVGNFQVMTNDQGIYQILLYAGNYNVSLVDPSPFTVGTPAGGTYSFNLVGTGTHYTGDFVLTSGVIIQDLQVSIYRWRFRPGFPVYVGVCIRNKGTIPMSGTTSLTYDSLLQYQSNAYGGTHDAGNRKVTFTFSGLQPTQSKYFSAKLITPASVPLGTPITTLAQVNPIAGDSTPQDNFTIVTDLTRGGADPNDKAVSPGLAAEGWVAQDQQLRYRIRFQNTGTDTAFNIYVLDTLDTNLNLHSIEVVNASHAYSLSIDDNRVMRWQFDNILLPDSNINEELSHGVIEFLVTPNASLPDSTEIRNFADIYFDFNTPVRTNTVLSTIWDKDSALFDLPTSYVQGLSGTLDFETLYPKVDIYTENKGIGENTQDIQFYIQLDNNARQLIGSTSDHFFAGGIASLNLTNFCIRNYYPGIPLTTAFRNSAHTLRFFAQETGKTNSLDSATFVVTVSNPLPVALIDFVGYVDQSTIQLSWTTAFEQNAEAFIIQKYQKTSSSYTDIGRVAAAGSPNASHSYQLIDPKPLTGINNYRLLQVDMNGNMNVLRGLEVNFQLGESHFQVVQLYPNPFEEMTQLKLFFPSSGEMELEVFDLVGKRVFHSRINVQAGLAEIPVNLTEHKSGTYLYRMRFNGDVLSGKMVKL